MNRLRPHSLPAAAMYYRIAAAGTALPATRMRSLRTQRANAGGGGVIKPCSRTLDGGGIAGRCGTRIHAVNTTVPRQWGAMHDLLSHVTAVAGHQPATKEGP